MIRNPNSISPNRFQVFKHSKFYYFDFLYCMFFPHILKHLSGSLGSSITTKFSLSDAYLTLLFSHDTMNNKGQGTYLLKYFTCNRCSFVASQQPFLQCPE